MARHRGPLTTALEQAMHDTLTPESLETMQKDSLKKGLWGTVLLTFGGSSVVGSLIGIRQARKDRAVANSSSLSHAERILEARQPHARAEDSAPGRA